MKQVLTTYFNHSRYLIPNGDHRHEGMREEASSTLIMASANQVSNWYHFTDKVLHWDSNPGPQHSKPML